MSQLVFSVLRHFKSLIDDQRKCIVQFSVGTMIFIVGMFTILITNHTTAPSLQQEIIVLVGAVTTAVGLFLVLSAHICLMLSRFKNL